MLSKLGMSIVVMGWVSAAAVAQPYTQTPGYQPSFGAPQTSHTEPDLRFGRPRSADEASQPLRRATPREQTREFERLLVCVRTLVEESRGGESSVLKAAWYLDAARAARTQSLEAIEDIVRNCEQALPKLKAHPYAWRSREWEALHASRVSPQTLAIIERILLPRFDCEPIRLGVNLGVYRLVNGVADCKGTNGRRELWSFSGGSFISGFSLGWDQTKGKTSRTAFYSMHDKQRITERYNSGGVWPLKQEAEVATVDYEIPIDEPAYSALHDVGYSFTPHATVLGFGFARSETQVTAKRIQKNWQQQKPDNRDFLKILLEK